MGLPDPPCLPLPVTIQKKAAFSDLNMPQGLRSSHLENHDVYRIYMNGEKLKRRIEEELMSRHCPSFPTEKG